MPSWKELLPPGGLAFSFLLSHGLSGSGHSHFPSCSLCPQPIVQWPFESLYSLSATESQTFFVPGPCSFCTTWHSPFSIPLMKSFASALAAVAPRQRVKFCCLISVVFPWQLSSTCATKLSL